MRRSPYKIISWYQLGIAWCKSREYVVNQRNIIYNYVYIYIHTHTYTYTSEILRIGWFNLIRYQKLLVLWLQRPGVAIPRPYVDAAVSLVLLVYLGVAVPFNGRTESVKVLHLQDDPKIHAQSGKKTHDSLVLKWLGFIAFASGSWDFWEIDAFPTGSGLVCPLVHTPHIPPTSCWSKYPPNWPIDILMDTNQHHRPKWQLQTSTCTV